MSWDSGLGGRGSPESWLSGSHHASDEPQAPSPEPPGTP